MKIELEWLSEQIYNATTQNRVCRLHMSGEPLGRTVHPYGICKTSGGKIVMVVWQSFGFTKPGGKEGYRNLLLEQIDDFEISADHFPKRTDFNPADSQYKEWVFHI